MLYFVVCLNFIKRYFAKDKCKGNLNLFLGTGIGHEPQQY